MYDVDTRSLRPRFVDLGYSAEAFAESRDGNQLYVATGDKNVLLDVDVRTDAVVASLTGIKDVYGLVAR